MGEAKTSWSWLTRGPDYRISAYEPLPGLRARLRRSSGGAGSDRRCGPPWRGRSGCRRTAESLPVRRITAQIAGPHSERHLVGFWFNDHTPEESSTFTSRGITCRATSQTVRAPTPMRVTDLLAASLRSGPLRTQVRAQTRQPRHESQKAGAGYIGNGRPVSLLTVRSASAVPRTAVLTRSRLPRSPVERIPKLGQTRMIHP